MQTSKKKLWNPEDRIKPNDDDACYYKEMSRLEGFAVDGFKEPSEIRNKTPRETIMGENSDQSSESNGELFKKAKQFVCTLCKKAFIYSSNLKRHTLSHTGKSYQIYSKTCPTCKKIFATKWTMKEHEESVHKDIKYLCKYCDAALTTKKSIRHHVGRFHKDMPIPKDTDLLPVVQKRAMKKEYRCNLCDRVCSGPSDLETHGRTHSGEKPFSCTECDKSYSQPSDLRIHIRSHTGEKPYICQLCDRSYVSSTRLRSHQRQHVTRKRYSCNSCEKSLATAINLKVHKRTHTGLKLFSCSEC